MRFSKRQEKVSRPITDGFVPPQNVVDLRPKPPQKPRNRWPVIFGLAIVLLAVIAVAVWFFVYHKPAYKPNTLTTLGNLNYVIDDPQGVKFAITKDFTVMGQKELKQTNPLSPPIYGFKQADVANVACLISQTKRTQSGTVTPEVLRDGTYSQLKKSFPDAKGLDYTAMTLKNGHEAAQMLFDYHDKSADIRQPEIVAATDTRTTFAFCTSPTSLFEHYLPTFNDFFSSLEVY